MGKTKKTEENDENVIKEETEEIPYEKKIENACVIAKPMASRKLTKKMLQITKERIVSDIETIIKGFIATDDASKHKSYVRNGLKDVQKRIRKGETGILFFAADVSPIDIMVHLPGVCEDKNIPYCYTPSRTDLGAALGLKRGSLLALVREKEEYKEMFDELKQEIQTLAVEL